MTESAYVPDYVVQVRNTFLQVDEAEVGAPSALARGRSEPAPAGTVPDDEEEREEFEDTDLEEFEVDAPLPPPDLCRWVTMDTFEDL